MNDGGPKTARALFLPRELVIAAVVAVLAQLSFVGLFLLPPPPAVEAILSDDNARPIAVEITPVPLLKLGSKNPGKLPSSWQRQKPAVAAQAPDPSKSPPPSAAADTKQDPAKRDLDGGLPMLASTSTALSDASTVDPAASNAGASGTGPASTAPASSALGAANGSSDGTETDPLKARAVDMYRAQLAAWFASRFNIRGKVPFDTPKTLSATVVVNTTPDRHVSGFSLSRPSGNAEFDEEVRATLSRIQSGGAELPAPPPAYPDVLTRNVPVAFRCTNRSQCE